MASATIELNCPGCGTALELDAGFAGGVCRCSTCGMLMTVPEDPAAKAPERLHRPESPDAPPRRPETPGEEPPTADDAPADEEGVTTYTTDTGETVRVDERKIPMASMKRKAAKWATVLAFVAVIGVLVGVSVLAIVILRGSDQQRTQEQIEEAFGYDPEANPFTAEDANLLGLPVTSRDAVVIDATRYPENWAGLVGENVVNALGKLREGARVAVLFATSREPRWLTPEGELARVSDLDLSAIREEADARGSPGRADLVAAVAAAEQTDPDRLLLVIGRTLDEEEDRRIRAALGDAPPGVEVILIGLGMSSVPLAEELAADFDGRAIRVPVRKLGQWWQARP